MSGDYNGVFPYLSEYKTTLLQQLSVVMQIRQSRIQGLVVSPGSIQQSFFLEPPASLRYACMRAVRLWLQLTRLYSETDNSVAVAKLGYKLSLGQFSILLASSTVLYEAIEVLSRLCGCFFIVFRYLTWW